MRGVLCPCCPCRRCRPSRRCCRLCLLLLHLFMALALAPFQCLQLFCGAKPAERELARACTKLSTPGGQRFVLHAENF